MCQGPYFRPFLPVAECGGSQTLARGPLGNTWSASTSLYRRPDARLTYRPGDRLSWLRRFAIFLNLSGHILYFIPSVLAQLVEALRYKTEDPGFDSRWDHRDFSLTLSFRPHYVPGVDSASNRTEYQDCQLGGKSGRCVGLKTLPPPCDDCLEIGETLTFWNPKGFYHYVIV
jgi:hypothetical protein